MMYVVTIYDQGHEVTMHAWRTPSHELAKAMAQNAACAASEMQQGFAMTNVYLLETNRPAVHFGSFLARNGSPVTESRG